MDTRYLDGRALSDLELLALLRHHGAATRLVDATRNALVALWFCVSENPDTIGTLIGIHSDFLGGYEMEPEHRSYYEIMGDLIELDHPMTWEPTAVSPRVAAQHSQFLYSALSTDATGSLRLPKNEGATFVIAVDSELKASAKEVLIDVFDIRDLTMFPDIDGFGRVHSSGVGEYDVYRW